MKKRLLEFLGYLGIGQKAFERKVGLSNGLVDKLSDNVRVTTLDKIVAVYPELNLNWLKTGEGDMLKSPERPKTADLTNDQDAAGVSMPREVFDQIKGLISTVAAQQSERGDFLELLKSQQRVIENLSLKRAAEDAGGAASKAVLK